MNTNERTTFVEATPRAHSRELTQRVERLELLRVDACAHRDRARVSLIDQQIRHAVLQWCDSYVMDTDTPARIERKVRQSPVATIN
jgi:hypothetical protein